MRRAQAFRLRHEFDWAGAVREAGGVGKTVSETEACRVSWIFLLVLFGDGHEVE